MVGQNTQRQAQKGYQNNLVEANKEQMSENRTIATTAYLDQAAQSNVALAQEREAAAQSNQNTATQGLQARGAVQAAGAESGSGGLALDSLMADFNRQEGMFRASNDRNLLFKQQQTASYNQSQMVQAQGRIAEIRPYIPSPIAPVDYIGTSLQAAQSITSSVGASKIAQNNAARGIS